MCNMSLILQDVAQRHHQSIAPFWQSPPLISRDEFDALKREMEELKKLLPAVRAFDKVTGQGDCEHADKVALVKKLAAIVGVDLNEVL